MGIRILSTKILSPLQKAILTDAHLKVEEYNAITIELFDPEIDHTQENIIFTSQNTVNAFLRSRDKIAALAPEAAARCIPISKITAFCVGEKTQALLEQNGIKVLETTHYGADLSKILIEKYSHRSFLFLCGNKRLEEIPTQLSQHGIAYTEQVVYGNRPDPQRYPDAYSGILFFSPTGIASFTLQNKLQDSIAFCIGTTTAAEAKKYTQNIILAAKPTVESVLEKVVDHYKTVIN